MKPTFKTSWTALAVAASLSPLMAQEAPGPRGGPGGPGGPGGGPRGGGNPVIAALDLDKDGVISAEELAKASASLAALDKNKDGQLTADEFRPGPGGGGPGFGRVGNPEEFVARILENDRNKDGRLTTDEIPDGMQGLLGRADADKDGAVTKAELEELAKNFSAGRGGPGGAGGRGGRGERNGPARPAVPPTAPPAAPVTPPPATEGQ